MAIEIRKKQELGSYFWTTVLSIVAVVLALGLLGFYFYFSNSISKIKNEISEKENFLIPTDKEKELEEKVKSVQERINSIANLISNHKNTSKIFSVIEENCLPLVWFSDFNFEASKNSISLSGRAPSFMTLQQQLDILKSEELLKDVTLSSMAKSKEGGIDFSISFSLDSKIFSGNDNKEGENNNQNAS